MISKSILTSMSKLSEEIYWRSFSSPENAEEQSFFSNNPSPPPHVRGTFNGSKPDLHPSTTRLHNFKAVVKQLPPRGGPRNNQRMEAPESSKRSAGFRSSDCCRLAASEGATMLVTDPLACSRENVVKRLKHDKRRGVVNDFSLMSKLGGWYSILRFGWGWRSRKKRLVD
jgi:hypothetical protein